MPEKQFSMHFDPVGDVLAATKACEAAVFLEAYGNTAEQWRDEYERYDAASVFISVLEPMGDAVASCRLILPNPVGLKSLVDVEGEPWFVDANRSAGEAGMVPARTLGYRHRGRLDVVPPARGFWPPPFITASSRRCARTGSGGSS